MSSSSAGWVVRACCLIAGMSVLAQALVVRELYLLAALCALMFLSLCVKLSRVGLWGASLFYAGVLVFNPRLPMGEQPWILPVGLAMALLGICIFEVVSLLHRHKTRRL